MNKSSVSWLIAIIVSTKSCVTSIDFPMLSFKSILPSADPSIISKPIQYLYQTPVKLLNFALGEVYNDGKSQPQSNKPKKGNFKNLHFKNITHGQLPPTSESFFSKPNELLQTENTTRQSELKVFYTIPYSMSVPVTQYPLLAKKITKNNTVLLDLTTSGNRNLEFNKIDNQDILTKKSEVFTTELVERTDAENIESDFDNLMEALDQLERKFYQISYEKFLSISPQGRQENGITFAQSGLFLYLELMALCTESDEETKDQIKRSLGLKTTCMNQIQVLKEVISNLPTSSNSIKFRSSSRIILDPQIEVSKDFLTDIAPKLHILSDNLNNTDIDDHKVLAKHLNHMVETDSGGAMQNTFDEDDLSNGICAVWLTTMYMRARWRSSPTVLNGSRQFYDGSAPPRTVSMFRINDIMQYASLEECDSEAIEIRYAHPDLTVLLIIPHERSLNNAAKWISSGSIQRIYHKMRPKRVAVTLPMYTLRMTLLLPGKLETIGMTKLVTANAYNDCDSLKLSHAVQRIMFWSEAGRNAFKDDGIEWDEAPELERIVNHPYIFFVRWRNLTLLNGNFVL